MSQPSSYRPICLVDAQQADRRLVDAYLYRDYPAEALEEVEALWADARRALAGISRAAGGAQLEHSHWNWRNKIESVKAGEHLLVAVELKQDGLPQGLMAVSRLAKPARLRHGHVLYIDYLESAPWNLRSPISSPRFLGVGTQLVTEAVRLSLECGWDGAVGLHSLPQAEAFYGQKLGMERIGFDAAYYNLAYFEWSGPQAVQWLTNVGGQS
jgi:hypothetical protein